MPDSQVPSIHLNQDGTIDIQVDVYDFDAGTPIEISGQATQDNGAIASFYSVQDVPAHDDGQNATIWLRSVPVDAKEFDPGIDVTITVKAGLAWVVQLDAQIPPLKVPPLKGAWQSDSSSSAVQPPPPPAPPMPPAQ